MAKDDHVVDDAPFDIPAFDEKEYIRKELISFKQTVVLFFLSIAAAGVSFALWRTGLLPDGTFPFHLMLALVLGFITLPFLLKTIRVNVRTWKRKEWLGTMALYLFFWLGFFLLFVNPPVTDATAPKIEAVVSPLVQAPNGTIEFGAYVADNVGVDASSVRFCVKTGGRPAQPPTELPDCNDPITKGAKAFWYANLTRAERGEYTWFLTATDTSGHRHVEVGTFNVTDPIMVDLGSNGTLRRSTDTINIQVHPGLRTPQLRVVQFSRDGGTSWNDTRIDPSPEKASRGWWTTDPSYKGWAAGSHRVMFRALEQPLFLRHASSQVGPNAATDADPAVAVSVSADYPDLGTIAPPARPEARFLPPGATPGLELPALLVAGLAGAALWRRRRDA